MAGGQTRRQDSFKTSEHRIAKRRRQANTAAVARARAKQDEFQINLRRQVKDTKRRAETLGQSIWEHHLIPAWPVEPEPFPDAVNFRLPNRRPRTAAPDEATTPSSSKSRNALTEASILPATSTAPASEPQDASTMLMQGIRSMTIVEVQSVGQLREPVKHKVVAST